MNAVGFMTHYTTMMGDHAPDRERTLLPVGLTVKTIMKAYERAYSTEDTVKQSQFYDLWKKHFPHVSCQKVCYESVHCTCMCYFY